MVGLFLLGYHLFPSLSSPVLPEAMMTFQRFDERFLDTDVKISQKDAEIQPASFDSIQNSVNGWVVEVVSSDTRCGSTITESVGLRTGCLKRSESTSLQVSCNSTTILMKDFSSDDCSGQPNVAWTTPIGTCRTIVSQSSQHSCISDTSSLPLPTGDWYTSIYYDDTICVKKNSFHGWKNNVCSGGPLEFSFMLSWPLFYGFEQSNTCTGKSKYNNVSTTITQCDQIDSARSRQYFYLNSDGSSFDPSIPMPTLRPSQQQVNLTSPTTKPSRKLTTPPSKKPTQVPTLAPSNKPSRDPTFTPTTKSSRRPTTPPSKKPTQVPTLAPSNKPSRDPTFTPTTKSSRRPTTPPSTKPTRTPTLAPTLRPSRNPTANTTTTDRMNVDNLSGDPVESTFTSSSTDQVDFSSVVMIVSCGLIVLIGLLMWWYCKRVSKKGSEYRAKESEGIEDMAVEVL